MNKRVGKRNEIEKSLSLALSVCFCHLRRIRDPRIRGYKTFHDRCCPDVSAEIVAVVFRGSASAEDKYTPDSFESALNVNTAGERRYGNTVAGQSSNFLVPCDATPQQPPRPATVKLKSVKANGLATL